ncbi:MAG TPA: hypothetical protein VGL13_13610 [Polyangiaceae bacterium]|jgi:hypothetical protein
MMSRRLRAIAGHVARLSPDERREAPEKGGDNSRDAWLGAVASLFGALILLALIASGLVLRPAAKRSLATSTPSAAEPTLSAPSAAVPRETASAAVPSAESSAAAVAEAPVLRERETPAEAEQAEGQDVENASSRRRHNAKGGGKATVPATRNVRKSDKRKDGVLSARDTPDHPTTPQSARDAP